ncbi:MAG TPA: hypothetical protein VLZ84_07130 [Asticcacaulis sp.]|nr:hypothetical protein [Asticcacaulis sp.]
MYDTHFQAPTVKAPVFTLTRSDLRAGDTVTIVRGLYAFDGPRQCKIVRIRAETTGVYIVADFNGIAGAPAVIPVEWLAMPEAL